MEKSDKFLIGVQPLVAVDLEKLWFSEIEEASVKPFLVLPSEILRDVFPEDGRDLAMKVIIEALSVIDEEYRNGADISGIDILDLIVALSPDEASFNKIVSPIVELSKKNSELQALDCFKILHSNGEICFLLDQEADLQVLSSPYFARAAMMDDGLGDLTRVGSWPTYSLPPEYLSFEFKRFCTPRKILNEKVLFNQ